VSEAAFGLYAAGWSWFSVSEPFGPLILEHRPTGIRPWETIWLCISASFRSMKHVAFMIRHQTRGDYRMEPPAEELPTAPLGLCSLLCFPHRYELLRARVIKGRTCKVQSARGWEICSVWCLGLFFY